MENGQQSVPRALKLFVYFHCFMILTYSVPLPSEELGRAGLAGGLRRIATYKDDLLKLIVHRIRGIGLHRDYMLRTGLWQEWAMFAPDPPEEDLYLDQLVTFRDGTVAVHRYPRMSELSLWDRYRQEACVRAAYRP